MYRTAMSFQTRIICIAVAILGLCAANATGQTGRSNTRDESVKAANLKATAAYAEVALRRAEMEAEVESLLLDYTDDFPRIKELRFALGRVRAESDRLTAITAAENGKATTALGKLIVRKIESEIDLWKLQQNYAEGHPDVKKAKKRVEVFENAIKEILG